MTQDNHPAAAETLGARLDAVLAPFAADEQRLQSTITELEAKVAELQADIEGSRTDLSVVQSSKIESLREAAKSDPLLSAAFMGLAAAEAASENGPSPSPDNPEEPADDGSHSLLKM